MKKFKGIDLNGTRYYEDSKCPSCSSEVDKGGRMKLMKRARYFLSCDRCKYSILSKKTQEKKDRWQAKQDGLKY